MYSSKFGKNPQEQGGATVEVALLSLLMVPMMFYAIFFFDLSLVNIKTLEASRYAVWEMSIMEISRWEDGKHIDVGTLSLDQEVIERWGDDMNSATSNVSQLNSHPGIFNERQSALLVSSLNNSGTGQNAVSVNISDASPYMINAPVTNEASSESSSASGGIDFDIFAEVVDKIAGFLGKVDTGVYGYFEFNTNGFAETEVSVKLNFDKTAPVYKGEKLLEIVPEVRGRQKLLVDAWDLKDGSDVDVGQKEASNNVKYYSQVNKMTFGKVPKMLNDVLGRFGEIGKFMVDLLGIRNPFATVVRSLALKDSSNFDSSVEFGDKRANPNSGQGYGAPTTFYTNVFQDMWQKDKSPYYNAYEKSKKGYYMGCDKPQTVDRQKCWQN